MCPNQKTRVLRERPREEALQESWKQSGNVLLARKIKSRGLAAGTESGLLQYLSEGRWIDCRSGSHLEGLHFSPRKGKF